MIDGTIKWGTLFAFAVESFDPQYISDFFWVICTAGGKSNEVILLIDPSVDGFQVSGGDGGGEINQAFSFGGKPSVLWSYTVSYGIAYWSKNKYK